MQMLLDQHQKHNLSPCAIFDLVVLFHNVAAYGKHGLKQFYLKLVFYTI